MAAPPESISQTHAPHTPWTVPHRGCTYERKQAISVFEVLPGRPVQKTIGSYDELHFWLHPFYVTFQSLLKLRLKQGRISDTVQFHITSIFKGRRRLQEWTDRYRWPRWASRGRSNTSVPSRSMSTVDYNHAGYKWETDKTTRDASWLVYGRPF